MDNHMNSNVQKPVTVHATERLLFALSAKTASGVTLVKTNVMKIAFNVLKKMESAVNANPASGMRVVKKHAKSIVMEGVTL